MTLFLTYAHTMMQVFISKHEVSLNKKKQKKNSTQVHMPESAQHPITTHATPFNVKAQPII